MKKAVFGLLIVMAIVLSSGCMEKTETKQEVIHAYVGAGMQKPMDEIAKMFEKKYGIKVEYDYAGSGYLYSKILATKEGDIFMPGLISMLESLKRKVIF